MSIGEVLSLLREEFPDITISKIRFLESQGLIVPERTPSGYRKFFDADIETLRWVLRQQRDHFLPLKVIKAKLDGQKGKPPADDLAGTDEQPSLFGDNGGNGGDKGSDDPPGEDPIVAALTATGPSDRSAASKPAADPPGPARARSEGTSSSPAKEQPATGHPASAVPAAARSEEGEGAAQGDAKDPAAWLAALQESPDPNAPDPTAAPPERTPRITDLATHLPETTYTAEQLATEAGVELDVVLQLQEFGLLVAGKYAGEATFDEAGLAVVKAASSILGRGVEARHLRGYKLAAEREVGLFEQLVLPLLRQRNPEARQQAQDTLDEMIAIGQALREALITQALRAHLRRS